MDGETEPGLVVKEGQNLELRSADVQVNRMRSGRQFGQMIGPGTTSADELPTVCCGISSADLVAHYSKTVALALDSRGWIRSAR